MSRTGRKIYYTKPSITDLEVQYAADAAANGWGDRCYSYITRFEQLFAQHLGVKYAIATSSCTGALHMGLAALDIKPGDEIIVPETTWIATVAPVTYLGATPIIVDVQPDTWCLDPHKVEAAITSRTKAIIAVHVYGNVCDMDALRTIGERYGIAVVEDAAEAIGSNWRGQPAGTLGAFSAFSFHGTKTLTTGEGGLFATNDQALYEKVLTLSNHGRAAHQERQFWPDLIGYKYKMSNVQAAIGCAQIERIGQLIKRKREIFELYAQRLADLPLTMNPEPPGTVNGYWMPTVVVNEDVPFDRDKLLETFKSHGIDGRVFFWPLSMLPMFVSRPENSVAYSLSTRAVNLPSYHDLTEAEVSLVCSVVKECLPH